MEKKQIRLFYTTKEFEEFVNHETVEVIDIQIKAMENSAMFQESFFAIVFYKDVVIAPSESSDKGAEELRPEEFFAKHLNEFRFGILRSSLDHYLATGRPSGTFMLAIRKMFAEYALYKREGSYKQDCAGVL